MTSQAPSLEANQRLTPMMQQYFAVKNEHPGAIVLFRMGDFFETFHDDAETCARLLDITLTARSKEKDPVPMAGVPHHAVEGYVARLINDHQRTVVLVDQVEDPKLAKGLVKREVTRVLTPGTFIDPSQSSRRASFLAAVTMGRPKRGKSQAPVIGLAALDLGTGEFRATTLHSVELMLEELHRLEAKEVLCEEDPESPTPLVEPLRITGRLVATLVAPISAPEASTALASLLGSDEADGLAAVLPEEARRAAGLVLRYAEHTQLREASFEKKRGGTLGHISALKPYLPGEALVLDGECRAHLELFRSASGDREGALLTELDSAKTAMGGRLLASWLQRPSVDLEEIETRLDAVEALVRSPSALDRVRRALEQVYDLDRLISRVMMARAGPKDLAALRVSLAQAPLVFEAALRATGDEHEPSLPVSPEERAPARGRLAELCRVDCLAPLHERLAEVVVEDPPAELGKGTVFLPGFDAELDEWVRLSSDGKGVLVDLERRERERTGIGSLKVRYNRVFGYFIEVTKANLASVPKDYIRKQTTVNGERYFTEELKGLEERILSADEKRLARESLLFQALVQEVTQHVLALRELSAALAQLDVLAAFAFLAERREFTRPELHEGDEIEILDGRHPVLEARAELLDEGFVPNDLSIGGEHRLMIITGPNMAGKSTIMRQTALIALMAQMGCFVPAKRARLGLVDRIFTRVGASDDLSRGRSTFMVEMLETARILRSATPRSLVILDEIGRGTSTFDGLSIAWAVAEHLHDTIRARTLFATHYHELTDISRERPGIVNFHVAVKEWNEQIVFLRKLLPGPTNKSYGVQVARLAGLPAVVLARARELLSVLETHELTAVEQGAFDSQRPGRPVPQLDLFVPRTARDRALELLREDLLALGLDDLSPRQAWDLLSAWQSRMREEEP